MRVTIGVFGVLGLSVSVGLAQPPGSAPPRTRSATLLPPEALPPGGGQTVARAASEELPAPPGTTPVTRPPGRMPGGPTWLNTPDPYVRPAAGVATGTPQPRTPTPPNTPKVEPSLVSRGLDKLKGAFAGDTPPRPNGPAAAPGTAGAGTTAANNPNNTAAFRGTTAGGTPVFAGPPAYRWYGWGSVTPGANPYAPAGQYPKASANWYTITGATPGAFPVPVTNPLRPPAGTEPPTYAGAPARPTPRATPVAAYTAPPPPAYTAPPAPERPAPPPETHQPEPTSNPTPPVAIPTMPAAPVTLQPVERGVAPVTVPTLTPPPLPAAPPPPPVERTPAAADPEPPREEPPAPLPLPAAPTTPAPEVKPSAPAPLPGSVTDDQFKWQPKPGAPAPEPGNWSPVPAKPQTQAAPPPAQPNPVWQGPRGHAPAAVARGQAGDDRPDPTAALVRTICDKRAAAVEVRWTGSKRLAVSFDCRTAADAQKLVSDISARPELAPLQIDFRVGVK